MPVFSRKKSEEPLIVAVVPDKAAGAGSVAGKSNSGKNSTKQGTPKKGKPTPKRSEAQAARRQPIVQSTTVSSAPRTKEERVALREKQKVARDQSYEGLKRGDEKHLGARDKGPQRRYIRQYVDARRNLSEYFMPASFLLIILYYVAMTTGLAWLVLAMIVVLYLLILAVAVDLFMMWRKLKAQLVAKFGTVEKGTLMYSTMRAAQLRRMRIPNPQGPRGIWPS